MRVLLLTLKNNILTEKILFQPSQQFLYFLKCVVFHAISSFIFPGMDIFLLSLDSINFSVKCIDGLEEACIFKLLSHFGVFLEVLFLDIGRETVKRSEASKTWKQFT